MTCEKCTHSKVCFKQFERELLTPKGFILKCRDFKDRSKFIELPCKAGDTVWSKTAGGFIWSWVITQIRIYEDDVIIEDDSCNYYNPSDFGKSVFLTREEAEARLKELNK